MKRKSSSHNSADSESKKATKNSSKDSHKNENKSAGRLYTKSIAIPGSILENAQSPELRTYLAGQIARALVIFNVDEVIIFNESPRNEKTDGDFKGSTKASDPNVLLARILQYLECPQYLRKFLFPRHPDLKYAGLLNPLDCPHHMRIDDASMYREGIILDRPVKKGEGSFVNVGLRKDVKIDKRLKAGLRVTVKIDEKAHGSYGLGKIVAPSEPRSDHGLYWGYNVRIAHKFGSVFTQCPYKDGYDVTIGTSERGTAIKDLQLASFRHMLIVFGGLGGLEASLESDESLLQSEPGLLFDHYLNSCPDQGSRTIRTEEAVLVTLAALKETIDSA